MKPVLQQKFRTVVSILAQQESHPGYAEDILMAIVNSELQKLEAEMDRAVSE